MLLFILTYIGGLAIVSYLLCAWFLSGAALHIAEASKALGIAKKLWVGYDANPPVSKQDLDDYLIGALGGEVPLWLELLCCPICLSFHLSWIVAVLLFLLPGMTWYVFVAALSWPAGALLIFSILKAKL